MGKSGTIIKKYLARELENGELLIVGNSDRSNCLTNQTGSNSPDAGNA